MQLDAAAVFYLVTEGHVPQSRLLWVKRRLLTKRKSEPPSGPTFRPSHVLGRIYLDNVEPQLDRGRMVYNESPVAS